MLVFFLFFACWEVSVPEMIQDAKNLELDRERGVFYDQGEPFSGYAITKNSAGTVVEKAGFFDGKRHGKRSKFYSDKKKSEESHYLHGKKDGVSKTWWKNGQLRSQSNFVNGVPHGVQRQWYQSGALFKEIHLDNGKEKGLQRAWRENGDIYNNYEAKDGRIYGLRRSKLCFELKEEEIVRAD